MHSNLHTGGILADDGAAVRGRRRVPAGRGKTRRSDDAPHCRIVIMPAGSCVVVALRPWWREAKLTVNSPFRLSDRMGAPCRGDRMRVCIMPMPCLDHRRLALSVASAYGRRSASGTGQRIREEVRGCRRRAAGLSRDRGAAVSGGRLPARCLKGCDGWLCPVSCAQARGSLMTNQR